jgi:hypothetical protein
MIKFNARYFLTYSLFVIITCGLFVYGSSEVLSYMNSKTNLPSRFVELQENDSLSETEYNELIELENSIINDRESSGNRFMAYSVSHFSLTLIYLILNSIFWVLNSKIKTFLLSGIISFVVLLPFGGALFQISIWAITAAATHFLALKINSRWGGK